MTERQGFFHWQLEFAPVFARGGFDLQVGNPPWVRPMYDEAAILAENDPWWILTKKPSNAEADRKFTETLSRPGAQDLLVAEAAEVNALKTFVSHVTLYPELIGLQPDLYRVFMSRTWSHTAKHGTIGLIHPESHFTDEKAGYLREATYLRLRRHWQFINELRLFDEVHNLVTYGVHIYGEATCEPCFLQATGLYHPETVTRSLRHDGSGEEPGFRHEDQWDRRPHASRIQTATSETLSAWQKILGEKMYAIAHA